MVEPDSAEPICKPPRSVSRSGGVAGVVEFGDICGEGRIYRAGAPVLAPGAAAERRWRRRGGCWRCVRRCGLRSGVPRRPARRRRAARAQVRLAQAAGPGAERLRGQRVAGHRVAPEQQLVDGVGGEMLGVVAVGMGAASDAEDPGMYNTSDKPTAACRGRHHLPNQPAAPFVDLESMKSDDESDTATDTYRVALDAVRDAAASLAAAMAKGEPGVLSDAYDIAHRAVYETFRAAILTAANNRGRIAAASAIQRSSVPEQANVAPDAPCDDPGKPSSTALVSPWWKSPERGSTCWPPCSTLAGMAVSATRDDGSQPPIRVATAGLPQGAGHPFCERLNQDSERGWLRCFRRESVHSVPYTEGASEFGLRPLLPAAVGRGPGIFDGLDSERAIAWRAVRAGSGREAHENERTVARTWPTKPEHGVNLETGAVVSVDRAGCVGRRFGDAAGEADDGDPAG